jgi:hypothetical protein
MVEIASNEYEVLQFRFEVRRIKADWSKQQRVPRSNEALNFRRSDRLHQSYCSVEASESCIHSVSLVRMSTLPLIDR